MARSGHLSSQSLQQIQSCGRAATTLSLSSNSKTFLGQSSTHIPQPLHQSRLMWCSFNFGLAISASFRYYKPAPAGISALQVTEIVSSITMVIYRAQHLKIIRCLVESQGKGKCLRWITPGRDFRWSASGGLRCRCVLSLKKTEIHNFSHFRSLVLLMSILSRPEMPTWALRRFYERFFKWIASSALLPYYPDYLA